MIELNNISKSYNAKEVIKDFSLNINRNEFIAIVGESGKGKSTLLNILGTLEKVDSGKVKICGVEDFSSREIEELRRYKLGFVFQNYALIDNETVKKNLLIAAYYKKDFKENDLNEVLQQVGLTEYFLNRKIYELSGGEQQRVALARILLKPCEIILADEPTGNLDKKNTIYILSVLNSLKKQGKTIVCVTHDEIITENADRVIYL